MDCDPAEASYVDGYRNLAEQLGCSFAVLAGNDPASAIIQAARDAGSDHVVLGEVRKTSLLGRIRPTIVDRIIDELPDADIHVIARFKK